MATVTTLAGEIFSTSDGGNSWREIESPCVEYKSLSPGRIFGTKDNKTYWMAGGALSIEGVWGKIYEQQSSGSWLRYDIPDFALTNALYTSETEVFATGTITNHEEGRAEGGLLYSSDRGNTWSIIYRNTQVKTILGLQAIDPKFIWAVDAGGLILKLESSPENTPYSTRK